MSPDSDSLSVSRKRGRYRDNPSLLPVDELGSSLAWLAGTGRISLSGLDLRVFAGFFDLAFSLSSSSSQPVGQSSSSGLPPSPLLSSFPWRGFVVSIP